ncbi:MAG: hypothetical protein ACT4OP_13395 [Actinomycetota bacterium]
MDSKRRGGKAMAVGLVLTVIACGGGQAVTTTTGDSTDEELFEPFDPGQFGSPTDITNQFLPMPPGSQLIYEGFTIADGEEIPHRVVWTVTDLTKQIGDVRTVVLWEEDYQEGEILEAEIAFFAEDDLGNVWLLGEYPEEYENGEIVATPAWISGFQDARPGIILPADPELGTPSYAQGWGPAVEWYDRGQVFAVGESTCVASGCYEDIVVIDEFSLVEPHFFQVKSYAPGVGLVQVGWKGPDPDQETLELVEIRQLSPEELAAARAAALELEARAYELNPAVYGTTPPAE